MRSEEIYGFERTVKNNPSYLTKDLITSIYHLDLQRYNLPKDLQPDTNCSN